MKDLTETKPLIQDLIRRWENLLADNRHSPEIEYRLYKMILHLHPLADRIYMKTVHARELILQCIAKTDTLRQELRRKGPSRFVYLTDIERTFEIILKKTYEFRVKAG